MSNGILIRQNEDNSIAMLAAQRQLYSDAKKLNKLDIALAVWIPFVLAVVLLFVPENEGVQYVSYILSVVSMIFSFIVDKFVENKKNLAAFIQQKFDVYVYKMPWNEKKFGKDKNVNHEIVNYSKKIMDNPKEKEKLNNWYTPAFDDRNLNDGILLCQRENFWWDVELRKKFRLISLVLIILLIAFVFIMGLCKNERVAELLWRLVFVIPMLEWLLSTVKQLNKDIGKLNELDTQINDSKMKTMDDLQDIQKIIFVHRKECYAIPNCLYDFFRDSDEDKVQREANM